MRLSDHKAGILRFIVVIVLLGALLFLFDLWCLSSGDSTPPPLALPLPRRLLIGLGFIFLYPVTLIPLSVMIAASLFLGSRLSRTSSAAVTLMGFGVVLGAALWVPNPIIFWPMDVLGDHSLSELIGEQFAFHLVPSPVGALGSGDGFGNLFRWQQHEIWARLTVLVVAWMASLIATWMIDSKRRAGHLPPHQRVSQ